MTTTATLYIALELGQDQGVGASATQAAEKPRLRTVPARARDRLAEEIGKAKARFQLPADARVCTCSEAGRDGLPAAARLAAPRHRQRGGRLQFRRGRPAQQA